jgi:hypothetical protein
MRPHALRLSVLRQYRLGVKVAAIAAEHQVSTAFVSLVAHQNGLRRAPHGGGPQGRQPHPHRAEVLQAYLAGARPGVLARVYGCHPKTPRAWAKAAGHVRPRREKRGPRLKGRPLQLELFA